MSDNPKSAELASILVNVIAQEVSRINALTDPSERIKAAAAFYHMTFFATFQGIAIMRSAFQSAKVEPERAAKLLGDLEAKAQEDWSSYFAIAKLHPVTIAVVPPAPEVPRELNRNFN